jgi:hypothetical protein
MTRLKAEFASFTQELMQSLYDKGIEGKGV